jgi:hypothetical protein
VHDVEDGSSSQDLTKHRRWSVVTGWVWFGMREEQRKLNGCFQAVTLL